MAGLDLQKTFDEFNNPMGTLYKDGMMESCEWVDEAQRIIRMVISIPLFTRREIVCQVVADDVNKIIMFKSVSTDKCPVKKEMIRAEMVDCWQL